MCRREHLKLIITWLIEGSKGGPTRARILLELREKPLNMNQLSRRLGLNYRTVAHHIAVLEKHGLVARLADGYGAPYALSTEASEDWQIIKDAICRVLGDKKC